jgi:hypothetical protein
MTGQKLFIAAALVTVAALGNVASAHVPYLEEGDFSSNTPFEVINIKQSKAMYAHLDNADDVDHYVMQVDQPTYIYMHTSIPYCAEYRDFTVSYALVGPGLPEPDAEIPVSLAPGHGAIVVRDSFATETERVVSFEPFSARTYWEGPDYAITVEEPGEYQLIVWHEEGASGDYIAVIGREEIFGPMDILRAAQYTPRIRRQEELHIACSDV